MTFRCQDRLFWILSRQTVRQSTRGMYRHRDITSSRMATRSDSRLASEIGSCYVKMLDMFREASMSHALRQFLSGRITKECNFV